MPRQGPPPGLIYVNDSPDGPGIATRLRVSPVTVRRWRMKDLGPRTFLHAGRIAARVEDIDGYLEQPGQGTSRNTEATG